MRDAIALALSIAVPWIAGTLWIRAAIGRSAQPAAIAIGYGYLAGMFGVTLVMRALSLAGVRWGVAWIAAPIALLAVAAYFRLRALGTARSPMRTLGALATLTGAARAIFALLLLLTCIRLAMLGVEVVLLPLVPYDAFAHWATKSRVWYEYGRMVPFVSASEWGRAAAGTMHFTDTHPEYPGTVPLFQVWTALCLGRWDESLVNVGWVAACVSLGIAFYAQLRRLELGPVKAMFGTYALLSLPFLTIHVALAGIADLFVAIAYGLAAIAMWQWAITQAMERRRAGDPDGDRLCIGQAGRLALGADPRPGRRNGAQSQAGSGDDGHGGGGGGPLPRLRPVRASPARLCAAHAVRRRVAATLYEHLFVMDNWHLLWYAVVAVVVVNARSLLGERLAPMTVTIAAAVALHRRGVLFQHRVGRRQGREPHQPARDAHGSRACCSTSR